MRRPALLVIAALALLTGSAAAQPSPYGIGDEHAAPTNTGANPVPAPWAKPPADGSHNRMPQQLNERPSGFWTSNRPAVGGAYRWRMMGVGVLVLGITMFFVLRLLIRTSRTSRTSRASGAAR